MRAPIRLLLACTALAFTLALALTLTAPSNKPGNRQPPNEGFDGPLLPAGSPSPAFTLTDQHAKRVSSGDYAGKVTILAFLNSGCGAPCYLTAQQIRGALDELPAGTPTLLISTDRAADTPAHVREFLRSASLSGRVRYLTGPRSQLASIARAYRVVPANAASTPRSRGSRKDASSGSSAPPSSTYVVLIDRAGTAKVGYTIEQLTPEALAHDVRRLQSG